MKLSEFKKRVKEEFGSEKWEKIENSYAYNVYTATEEEQIEAVQNNGLMLEYINNPSEKVQLEAVRQKRYTIANIHNPTDKVLQEVIKKTDIKDTFELIYLLKFLENDLKE